jgi:hypothetical protein
MWSDVISIGIIFNAFVTATISISALILMTALILKRKTLNITMQAYAWFWWFTALVWFPSIFRYTAIGLGIVDTWVSQLDILVQSAVFFSGPPLFYFTLSRVTHNARLAIGGAIISLILAFISIWYVLQPNGIAIVGISTFSAEQKINDISLAIFAAQIIMLVILLLYDMWTHYKRYLVSKDIQVFLEGAYSFPILVYVFLGAIDESKIITDWPLVVFRMLYSGSLLTVFVLLLQVSVREETYLYIKGQKTKT